MGKAICSRCGRSFYFLQFKTTTHSLNVFGGNETLMAVIFTKQKAKEKSVTKFFFFKKRMKADVGKLFKDVIIY